MTRQGTARRPQIEAGAMMLAAALLYIAMSWSERAPQIFSDEAANLGDARWLVGGTLWPMGQASGASIGYPVLIAPIFAVVDSPELVYRLVIMLNALFAAVMAGVLYLTVRRGLGAGHRTALVSAASAAAYPAIAIQVGVAWVEIAAMLGMSAFILTLVCAARALSPLTVLSHGVIAGALGGLHGRFVAIPVLAVAGLLVLVVVRPRLRRWAAGSALAAVVLDVGLSHLAGLAQSARWTYVLPDISVRQVLAISPAAELRSIAGQGWYLLAGSLGLVALGIVGLVAATRSRRAPGPTTDGLGGRSLTVYALLCVGGVFAVSVTYMAIYLQANPTLAREDLIYYGRYDESFVPVLIALAVAVLLRMRSRRVVAYTLGAAVALIPVLWAASAALRGNLKFNGTLNPYMTTALDPYFGLDRYSLVTSPAFNRTATIVAVALTAAALLLAMSVRRLAPVLVIVTFLTIGILDLRHLSAHTNLVKAQIPAYQALAARSPATVAYDPSTVGVYMRYALPFWLNHSRFVSFDSRSARWPVADLFIGPSSWPTATAHGLRRLTVDRVTGRGLYVPVG